MKDEGFAGLPEHLQPSNLPHRNEQVTFQNLKDCAAAHKALLEERDTLQAELADVLRRCDASQEQNAASIAMLKAELARLTSERQEWLRVMDKKDAETARLREALDSARYSLEWLSTAYPEVYADKNIVAYEDIDAALQPSRGEQG